MKKESKNSNKQASTFKFFIKSVKMSDKRIRAFVKTITGKSVDTVISFLSIKRTKLFDVLYKFINSSITNITQKNINVHEIYINNISVDKGKFYKKIFTRSQGRVNYIKKKTSHISITFGLVQK